MTDRLTARRRVPAWASRIQARCDCRSNDSGLTLVEILVSSLLGLLVLALIPPIFRAVTASSFTSTSVADGSAQARLAVENLGTQVGSAADICLPTQFSSAGFTVRILQIVSTDDSGGALTTTYRWDQWTVTGNKLEEEESSNQSTTSASGISWKSWVTIAQPVTNSAVAPFSWSDGTTTATPASPTVGSPETLEVDLQVQVEAGRTAQLVEVKTTIAALDVVPGPTTTSTSTTSTTEATPTCATASPQQ